MNQQFDGVALGSSPRNIVGIRHRLCSLILRLFSRLLGVLDIFPVLSALYVSLTVVLLVTTFLAPVVVWLVPAADSDRISLDILDTAIGGLRTSFFLLPLALLPLIRHQIGIPPRTPISLFVYFVFAVLAAIAMHSMQLEGSYSSNPVGENPYTLLERLRDALNLGYEGRYEDTTYEFAHGAFLSGFMMISFGYLLLLPIVLFFLFGKVLRLSYSRNRFLSINYLKAWLSSFSVTVSKGRLLCFFLGWLLWSLSYEIGHLVPDQFINWVFTTLVADESLVGLVDRSTYYSLVGFSSNFIGLPILIIACHLILCDIKATGRVALYVGISVIAYVFAIVHSQSQPVTLAQILFGLCVFFGYIATAVCVIRKLNWNIVIFFKQTSLKAKKIAYGDDSKVLLLRPFHLDNTILKIRWSVIQMLLPMPRRGVALEEVIAQSASRVAPVVAVGKPGEAQPPLGALREYLSDDMWQDFVEHKIRECISIVFIAGSATFTAWETNKIIDSNAIDKLVIVIPPDSDVAISYFEENVKILSFLGLSQPTLDDIAKGKIRCIYTEDKVTRIVYNQGSSVFDYQMAMDYVFAKATR